MRSCPYAYFVLGKINLLQIWYRGFHNFFFFWMYVALICVDQIISYVTINRIPRNWRALNCSFMSVSASSSLCAILKRQAYCLCGPQVKNRSFSCNRNMFQHQIWDNIAGVVTRLHAGEPRNCGRLPVGIKIFVLSRTSRPDVDSIQFPVQQVPELFLWD